MLGGVGRVPGNGHPYPISGIVFRLWAIVKQLNRPRCVLECQQNQIDQNHF
jgi:hypothetical protein